MKWLNRLREWFDVCDEQEARNIITVAFHDMIGQAGITGMDVTIAGRGFVLAIVATAATEYGSSCEASWVTGPMNQREILAAVAPMKANLLAKVERNTRRATLPEWSAC